MIFYSAIYNNYTHRSDMESSKTEDLIETHRFHPFLLMTTTFLYIFCSSVISPLLSKSAGTKGRSLRKNEKYQLVSHLVHSVVVCCLTGYILLSGVSNWVKLSKSWLGFVTIEISFTYFVTDLTIYHCCIFSFCLIQ